MIYYNFILLEKLRAKDIGLSFLKEKDIGLKIKHEWDHCMTFKIKLSMLHEVNKSIIRTYSIRPKI
jgi:hypothetical protein